MPDSILLLLVVRLRGWGHLGFLLIYLLLFSGLIVAPNVLLEVLLSRGLQLPLLITLKSCLELESLLRLPRLHGLGLGLEIRKELAFLLCIQKTSCINVY